MSTAGFLRFNFLVVSLSLFVRLLGLRLSSSASSSSSMAKESFDFASFLLFFFCAFSLAL